MDFKVAERKTESLLTNGHQNPGITEQILTEALDQAKKARMEILEELTTTIAPS